MPFVIDAGVLHRVAVENGHVVATVEGCDPADRQTWVVRGPDRVTVDATATAYVKGLTDPQIQTVYEAAIANDGATKAIDENRVMAAVVWAVLDTYSAPATIAKFTAARTKIVNAYKSRPWTT